MLAILVLALAALPPRDLVVDLARGRPRPAVLHLAVGDRLTLRLPCRGGEWWSLGPDGRGVLARDRLPASECYFRDRMQVVEFRARRAGKARLRALRAAGSGPVTGELELEVTVEIYP